MVSVDNYKYQSNRRWRYLNGQGPAQALVASTKLDGCPLSQIWALTLPRFIVDSYAQRILNSRAVRNDDQRSTETAVSVIAATAVPDGTAFGDVSIQLLPEILEQLTELAVEFCREPGLELGHEDSTVSLAYEFAQRAAAKGSTLDLNLLFDLPVLQVLDTASIAVEITSTKTQDLAGVELIFGLV